MNTKSIQSHPCKMIYIVLNGFFQINIQCFMCPVSIGKWRSIVYTKKRCFGFAGSVAEYTMFICINKIWPFRFALPRCIDKKERKREDIDDNARESYTKLHITIYLLTYSIKAVTICHQQK